MIECKSGAISAKRISKGDANQLNGSVVWFEEKYDASCSATPIMVHLKTVFEHAASPRPDIRIMNNQGLERLHKSLTEYSISLSADGTFHDAKEVEEQLKHHKLIASEFVGLCTVSQGGSY